MASYFRFFRLAATLLLLSAAVDLIAVDMLGSLWQGKVTVQSELQGSCAQDDCFCCAPTIIPATPLMLAPTIAVTPADVLMTASPPFVSIDPLFRPPRV
jgi:hypothetical protein